MRNKKGGRSALMLVLVAWVCGCAQNKQSQLYEREQARYAHVDELDVLLLRTGVDLTEFPAGESWSAEQANNVVQLLRFKISDGNMSAYGPRVLVSFLLEEALKTGKAISRHALIEGLRRLTHLAVLNPEGHLVRAHSGAILLCVGPLHIQDGVPQAGEFKVDAFYVQDGDTFREDPQLVAPAIFTPSAPKPPTERSAGDGPR